MSNIKTLNRFVRHLPHIVSLYAIFAVTAVIFVVFSYNRAVQVSALAAAASAYVTWGVVHHLIHDDLTFAVIMEYLTFALLGFVIGVSILLR